MRATFLVSLCLLGGGHGNQQGGGGNSVYQLLVDSILDFSLATYHELSERRGYQENIIFSPFSVYSVLLVAHLGARGQTAQEICQTLGLCAVNISQVHQAFGSILNDLTRDKSLHESLAVANGLFVQSELPISDRYQYALRYYYSSGLEEVDFVRNSTAAQSLINSWVRQVTDGRVENALSKPPGEMTRMVMVNALHFSGEWMRSFDPKMTEPNGRFYVTPHFHVAAPMMIGKMNLGYGHSEEMRASILAKPFKDGRISMFFVLPDDMDGIVRVQKQLNITSLKRLIGKMKKTDVNMRIPRFTVDQRPSLAEILWSLGIRNLFSPHDADLSGISTAAQRALLHVSQVVHRARVHVDERGGLASAATATVVERIGTFTGPYFEANHPFIFFIMDKQSGVVLFMGRIAVF